MQNKYTLEKRGLHYESYCMAVFSEKLYFGPVSERLAKAKIDQNADRQMVIWTDNQTDGLLDGQTNK